MTRRWFGWAFVTGLTLLVGSAGYGEVTPEQKCQVWKNLLAGRYALCRHKAEAQLATAGDHAAYAAALARCAATHAARWTTVEQQAAKAGGACPSTGDRAMVQAVIDTHTHNVAAALAGGPLANCSVDLGTCQADLAACTGGAPQGQLIETGQTTCWNEAGAVIPCAGTGLDGELQKGLARSYTDNGDGTITDNRTGLMWEKLSNDGSIHDVDNFYFWADVLAVKIAALNTPPCFAGQCDWRLPNIIELESLIQRGPKAELNGPAVPPPFNAKCVSGCTILTCSCTGASPYWSSTLSSLFPSSAWFVLFWDGLVQYEDRRTVGFNVRAVRGGF